jgi:hypothetical protein
MPSGVHNDAQDLRLESFQNLEINFYEAFVSIETAVRGTNLNRVEQSTALIPYVKKYNKSQICFLFNSEDNLISNFQRHFQGCSRRQFHCISPHRISILTLVCTFNKP